MGLAMGKPERYYLVICPICGSYLVVEAKNLPGAHLLMRSHVRELHKDEVPDDFKGWGWTDRIVIVAPIDDIVKFIVKQHENYFKENNIPLFYEKQKT